METRHSKIKNYLKSTGIRVEWRGVIIREGGKKYDTNTLTPQDVIELKKLGWDFIFSR